MHVDALGLAVGFVILAMTVEATAAPPPASDVERRVAEAVRSFRGTMGVAAKNLATAETIAVDADRPFPTASTIKVAVMVEVFHQIAEGRIRHDTPVTLRDEDKVGGSGVLKGMHPGLSLTVDDLLHLMMAISDNTATNLLVRLVGTARVDERLVFHGFVRTKIFRPTFRDGHADVFPEEEKEFGLGVATPREMARLMERIAEGLVVDRAASDAMIALMRRQDRPTMIPRLISSEPDVVVANKPGWDEEKAPDTRGVRRHVRGDAGIITTPRGRYVVAIFARGIEDTRWGPDNEADVTGAGISRMIYEAFTR